MEYNFSIKVDDKWTDDGLELTADMIREAILDKFLPFAYQDEIQVKSIKRFDNQE